MVIVILFIRFAKAELPDGSALERKSKKLFATAPPFLLKPWWAILVGLLLEYAPSLWIRSLGLSIVSIWLSIDLWAWLLRKKTYWKFVIGWVFTSLLLITAMGIMWLWLDSILQQQRADVFDRLDFNHLSSPAYNNNPLKTKFTVTNNSRYELSSKHWMYCLVNLAVGNDGSMVIGMISAQSLDGLWFVPHKIPPLSKVPETAKIEAGGDAKTDECISAFSFKEGVKCVDVVIIVSYSLESQPLLEQRKLSRYVASKDETGSFVWYQEPIYDKKRYCESAFKPPQ